MHSILVRGVNPPDTADVRGVPRGGCPCQGGAAKAEDTMDQEHRLIESRAPLPKKNVLQSRLGNQMGDIDGHEENLDNGYRESFC